MNRSHGVVLAGGVGKGPVADLGDRVEVVVVPAGGKGTELRARWRRIDPADRAGNSREDLRLALRRMKQLVETGEILAVKAQPAGRRPPRPWSSVFDAVVRRSAAGGVR